MNQLIGRVLIGLLFVVSGIFKAMNIAGTAGYMAKLGFPAPEVMAIVAMLIELVGGAFHIVGWQTRKVAWFLALFVLVAIGTAHRFWEYDAAQRVAQMNNFLKDLAIVGGVLYVAAFGAGPASVDGS